MRGPDLKTEYVTQWKAGLDTRHGIFNEGFKSFRELTNCTVTVNGNIRTRPPTTAFGVSLDTDAQGWVYNAGQWLTFAPVGATITHTGPNAGQVVTKRFDVPPSCGANWTLIESGVHSDIPYALIQHAALSPLTGYNLYLHVWDGLTDQPTYVSDSYAPVNWSTGQYPTTVTGDPIGNPGAYEYYSPTTATVSQKLWLSRADGNVAFSGTSRLRVWNTRSVSDIDQNGTQYMFRWADNPVIVPEYYASISDGTFVSITCERLTTTGWTIVSPGISSQTVSWSASPVIQFDFTGTPESPIAFVGDLIRISLSQKPKISVVTGFNINPTDDLYTGDGAKWVWPTTFNKTVYNVYNLYIDGKTLDAAGLSLYGTFRTSDGTISGPTSFVFNSFSWTAPGAINNVTTTLEYSVATNTVFGASGVSVYKNGTLMTSGYTWSSVGTLGKITFSVTPSAGDQIDIRLIVPNGKTWGFKPISSAYVVSGGVLSTGAATLASGPAPKTIATTGYTPGGKYYITLSVGASLGDVSVYAIPDAGGLPTQSINWNYLIVGYFTATSTGGYPGVLTPYYYPNAENTNWNKRHLATVTYWSGAGDAGYLVTSNNCREGGLIVSMLGIKNRLILSYSQSTQLWAVDPDPTQNQFVDRDDFGSTGPTVQFYDRAMLHTQRGVRAFDLTGLNFQALTDGNLGEPIIFLGKFVPTAASFWPWFGGYVAFGTLTGCVDYAQKAKLPDDSLLLASDTQQGFLFLSYSKESETAAWSWNPIPSISGVNWKTLTPVDEKLFFVDADGTQTVYYFDGLASQFVDTKTGDVIDSRAITHFSHLGNPGVVKRGISIDTALTGQAEVRAEYVPWGGNTTAEWGPVIVGTSVGTPRIPFGLTGVTMALDIRNNDVNGFELLALDMKYVLGARR